MPYKEDGSDVPSRIKKYPASVRRQFAHIWNRSYARCQSGSAPRKKPGESCETYAFRIANGVLKRSVKSQGEAEDINILIDKLAEEADSVEDKCPCEDEYLSIDDLPEEILMANVADEKDADTYDEYEEGIPKELAWSTKQKGALPNAAFAVVEPCWKTNKSARHLPHHKSSVKSASENSSIDMAHLRNALARMNQIKSVCGGSDSSIRARAKSHLVRHAKSVLPSSKFNESEKLPEKQIEILVAALTDLMTKMEKVEFTNKGWKYTF